MDNKMNLLENKIATLNIKMPDDYNPHQLTKNVSANDKDLLDIEIFLLGSNFGV